jgi:hypothetical protein
MRLENQCVSLELAKKLKELGVRQIALFCWSETETVPSGRDYRLYYKGENAGGNSLDYSAFTVAELGEMLPDSITNEDDEVCWFYHDKNNQCHRVSYVHACEEICSPLVEVKGETEANARAKMLIYLIENKLWEIK